MSINRATGSITLGERGKTSRLRVEEVQRVGYIHYVDAPPSSAAFILCNREEVLYGVDCWGGLLVVSGMVLTITISFVIFLWFCC
jgi:hypothetical protein